ncbi:hypothetical protein FRC15_009799 [Serendipita sp. 397]|nr:hypothetical protein FRC15_009799 [Serendipita sp. 397]KAG8796730.1 hypothetical protein FRC16_009522 [Serendipita sp. 398]
MSKALGQAFLAYQVRQLESQGIRSQREPAKRRHIGTTSSNMSKPTEQNTGDRNMSIRSRAPYSEPAPPNRNKGIPSRIIIDASALIFALDQVKGWCMAAAKPLKIVVPLEGNERALHNCPEIPGLTCNIVLNTLDLLKKGTSFISVQARAASRLLEDQVGVNQRIVLQEDGAASVWHEASASTSLPPPLWLRNLLTCAIWERDHSNEPIALAFVESTRTFEGDESKGTERVQGKLVYEWAKSLGITPLSLAESRKKDNQVYSGRRPTPGGATEGRHRRTRNSQSSLPHEPLVEKQPPSQLATTGVRLLARGEKLGP